MNYKDYYKVLGVERNADADTIKKAFRKLARQHHPDVNKGDKKAEDRFKEINEANEVLSDPEKRKLYDQLGSDYQRYQQSGGDPRAYDWGQWFNRGGGRQGAPGRQGGMSEADLGDLFEQYFGGAGMDGFTRASRGGRRARDIEQPVAIALEEAYHGASRIFSKEGQEELEVKIPPGVKTGSRVRIRGQGVAGSKGQVGDLYLVIEVEPDTTYERKDDDLYRDAKVDAFTAMLGGEASVQTLAGTVVVKVPAGTSSGKMIRLRGKGMPKLSPKGEYGDLYLRVMVTVPRDLTEDEREALERIAQQRGAR